MCPTLCDSAGVMYWGDAYTDRIEAANTDGSGRRLIVAHKAHFYSFALHAGIIYYTDWKPPYVYLLSYALRSVKGASAIMTVFATVKLMILPLYVLQLISNYLTES